MYSFLYTQQELSQIYRIPAGSFCYIYGGYIYYISLFQLSSLTILIQIILSFLVIIYDKNNPGVKFTGHHDLMFLLWIIIPWIFNFVNWKEKRARLQ